MTIEKESVFVDRIKESMRRRKENVESLRASKKRRLTTNKFSSPGPTQREMRACTYTHRHTQTKRTLKAAEANNTFCLVLEVHLLKRSSNSFRLQNAIVSVIYRLTLSEVSARNSNSYSRCKVGTREKRKRRWRDS